MGEGRLPTSSSLVSSFVSKKIASHVFSAVLKNLDWRGNRRGMAEFRRNILHMGLDTYGFVISRSGSSPEGGSMKSITYKITSHSCSGLG